MEYIRRLKTLLLKQTFLDFGQTVGLLYQSLTNNRPGDSHTVALKDRKYAKYKLIFLIT